jgi:hypothetical protein
VPWVRKQLDSAPTKPQPYETLTSTVVTIVADVTFWGHDSGLCVFRSPKLGNLWWKETRTETAAIYQEGRDALEGAGWTIQAVVLDGRRGIAAVFKDSYAQMCHFHQQTIITRYLTRKPKSEAAQTLRSISLTLTKTTEEEFTKALSDWYVTYEYFLNEHTLPPHSTKKNYTHQKLRSAYRSLSNNLHNLFAFERHPDLNIPNTTNHLDGFFTQLKGKVNVHRGLRKDRRFKIIEEFLRGKN